MTNESIQRRAFLLQKMLDRLEVAELEWHTEALLTHMDFQSAMLQEIALRLPEPKP
jgi:hypothetical protein